MTTFRYVDGELCAEGVPLSTIAARYGTPTYVYSRAAIEASVRSAIEMNSLSVIAWPAQNFAHE